MCAFSQDHEGRGERNPQTPAPAHPAAFERSSAKSLQAGSPSGFGRPTGGFSLVELMASVTILLVVSSAIFSLLGYYQKVHGTTRLKADMYNNIRGVVELMAQEIGQAGLVSLPSPTLSAAVTASASAQAVAISSTACIAPPQNAIVDTGSSQETVSITAMASGTITAIFANNHANGAPVYIPPCLTQAVTASASAQAVTVSSTASMFVGEYLIIDVGAAQEVVKLTAVSASASTITAIFSQNHTASGAVGAPINVQGVFPYGVMSSSTATDLQLFGDIRADGSLVFVQYDCNAGTTTTPGTLTRSVTTVTPTLTTSTAPQTLLNNLVGATNSAGVVYAPNAVVNLTGASGWEGAIIAKTFTDTGSTAIHFDQALQTTLTEVGNFAPIAFSWSKF